MESLRKEGWSLSDGTVQEMFEGKAPTDGITLAKALCNEDMKDFGEPSIANACNKEDRLLIGPVVLQISRYRNVCQPKIRELIESEQSDTIIRLFLTDGHGSISAIIFGANSDVSADTPPGTKIKIIGRVALDGQFLFLQKADYKILGGRVEKLIEKWQIERNSMRVSDLKKSSNAPKWISFGKKGNTVNNVLKEAFRSNDALQPKLQEKEEADEKDSEFAKVREQTIRELKGVDEPNKKFSKPAIELTRNAQLGPGERTQAGPRVPKPPKDRKERREPRGRGYQDDNEDCSRPATIPTLFDFVSSSMPAEKPSQIRPESGNKILQESAERKHFGRDRESRESAGKSAKNDEKFGKFRREERAGPNNFKRQQPNKFASGNSQASYHRGDASEFPSLGAQGPVKSQASNQVYGQSNYGSKQSKPQSEVAFVKNDLQRMTLGGAEKNHVQNRGSFQTRGGRQRFEPNRRADPWQVGTVCKAAWVDGEVVLVVFPRNTLLVQFYTATIIEMGPGELCTVRYNDYNDVRTVPRETLLYL